MSSFYPYSLQDQGRAKAGVTDAEPLTPPAGTGVRRGTLNATALGHAGKFLIIGGILLWVVSYFMKG